MEVDMRGYIVALALLGSATPALATEIFDDTVLACTGINCSSLRVPGSVLNQGGAAAHPWVAQLFVGRGECVRLDVFTQGADLEMVAVAPNGTVYRNDDRAGATDRRPLVKLPPATGSGGWYTVQISNFDGAAFFEPNFVLFYGRYPGGNPNCAGTTPPFSPASSAEALKPDTAPQPPIPNAPGSQ